MIIIQKQPGYRVVEAGQILGEFNSYDEAMAFAQPLRRERELNKPPKLTKAEKLRQEQEAARRKEWDREQAERATDPAYQARLERGRKVQAEFLARANNIST